MSASTPPFMPAVGCASPEGRGPGSPRLPEGSALHPWALAASPFPGPPGPLATWFPSVLAEACLLVGTGWFSHLLVNSLCRKCAPSPRGISMGLQTLKTQERVKRDICEDQAPHPAQGTGAVVVM